MAAVLFTPGYCRAPCGIITMIRLVFTVFAMPAVIGIIVTDPPPLAIQYKYSYDIQDPTTGDTKSQHEVRQGNIVTGQYSVVEPDGTKRIVDYNVHPRKGFTAVVHTEPAVTQRTPAPVNNYVIPTNNRQAFERFELAPNKDLYANGNTVPLLYQAKTYRPNSVLYFAPANHISDGRSPESPLHREQYFVPYNRN
ncbi:unnamed protein product [Chilo suppressalis]|uniref:Uncharacterized protein n=1 Tax=Chilo suppressalis TaxID=168631 RepID=A0ABN8B3A2_CHISP|nr:unnamed protein product [Chilo suppressalis]